MRRNKKLIVILRLDTGSPCYLAFYNINQPVVIKVYHIKGEMSRMKSSFFNT